MGGPANHLPCHAHVHLICRVKDYCIHRGFAWISSVANTVCTELEYYEELMKHYRLRKRVRLP